MVSFYLSKSPNEERAEGMKDEAENGEVGDETVSLREKEGRKFYGSNILLLFGSFFFNSKCEMICSWRPHKLLFLFWKNKGRKRPMLMWYAFS